MAIRKPFIDPQTGALDVEEIRREAYPLVGLIALFGALGLVPFAFLIAGFGGSVLGPLLTLLTQFILALGTAIILMYVVARGIQLADRIQ